MVTVSGITYNRSAACIILDTGNCFWLRTDDLNISGIYEGGSYEDDAFMQQIRVLQYPRALNTAVSMLARRACSRKEILSRLIQRRYTEEVSELVVYKLEKENLIDDKAFCEQWIRFRSSRGYGPTVIRQELKMKGIPEELISQALDRVEPDEYRKNAVRMARKAWSRIRKDEDIRKARQKVTAALVRKGYGWEEARSACDKAEKQME